MSDYVKRAIDVIIQLGKGSFGDGGYDTVTLKALRVSADITKSGMPSYNMADLRIYGMRLDLMNKVSTLGTQSQIFTRNNIVSVYAGNATTGTPAPGSTASATTSAYPLVFFGTILEAWADFTSAPDVYFNVHAQTGLIDKMKPVPPTSYAGPTDVVTIMSGLATLMGRSFVNNGVSGIILSYPYFPGTAMDQAEACAHAADITFLPDDNTLTIWPKSGSRTGSIPLISAATGMVGYPSYTGTGVHVRTIYNPSILFGGQVKIESVVQPAQGTWVVNQLSHSLEAESVGGAWFTDVGGYRLGSQPTIPG